jgi:RNA-dependent RNA polymerase
MKTEESQFITQSFQFNTNNIIRTDRELVRRVYVTPLRLCPQSPEMDLGNRILRQYSDHRHRFLRVVFVDESFRSIKSVFSHDIFEDRLRVIATKGFKLAGESFQF